MRSTAPRLDAIAEDVTVRFAGGSLRLTGTLLFDPRTASLILDTQDGEPEEMLTVNLAVYGLFPETPDEILVKDWSEGEGTAQSLIDAGVAEFVNEHFVGPFSSRAVRLRLIKKEN
ncbi:hypothetical protein AHiyo8_01100 [Arthrobacter sp. Hiyo8]|uniref:hypothetical protein n=1 Tax=Arthrobacter sp. Hiyo1 TaxID=1588020 RepID=UPI00068397ED|nr:hypothetical protein [Arthrobacter sp. Hiyo1]BAS11807.1 hypothetical protein AHiyo8_01100 [Arthrobacter sp. Hiyo8]GAP61297.1 hypothetical protein AHiyo1_49850 [Arthrobacter sp. Hiyo1]